MRTLCERRREGKWMQGDSSKSFRPGRAENVHPDQECGGYAVGADPEGGGMQEDGGGALGGQGKAVPGSHGWQRGHRRTLERKVDTFAVDVLGRPENMEDLEFGN